MAFNSLPFIVFLSIFVPLFYLSGRKFKTIVLIVSSCLFFMSFRPEYIFLIILIIIVNFVGGIFIDKYESTKKKILLILLILLNIFSLISFKYFNFISDNFNYYFNIFSLQLQLPKIDIIIPIGLSFITFKSISYLIEIYRGNINSEKNISSYSLYVLFFPELIAGPIDRPKSLIPQFKNYVSELSTDNLKAAAYYLILGYFQKSVIADRLASIVKIGFNPQMNVHGPELILTILFFTVQIYCDFAGYSNIALGVAKLFGIDIMQNFERPYFSKSVSEFWRKWHISLSTWFRDYLFLPLAYYFTRKFKLKNYNSKNSEKYSYAISVLITMSIAGLWHGANWTFVIWGCLIGFYMIFGFFTKKYRKSFWKLLGFKYDSNVKSVIQIISTLIFLTFAWIFFRSDTVSDALLIINNIFIINSYNLNISKNEIVLSLFLILVYFGFEFLQNRKFDFNMYFSKLSVYLKTLIILIIISFIIFIGLFSSNQFIYLKF